MIIEPLAHLLSVRTVPTNSFGQILSGELVLKGLLFKRIWPWLTKSPRDSLSFDSFDYEINQLFPQSSMTYSVYFLPLAKAIGQGRWEAIEVVAGIYLQVVPDNGMSTKRVFRRVGYAEFTELEEPKTEYDKARNIEWTRLAQVSSPYKDSEEVLII